MGPKRGYCPGGPSTSRGCELPKGEKLLQVEVAPDYDSETAIFTGNVK